MTKEHRLAKMNTEGECSRQGEAQREEIEHVGARGKHWRLDRGVDGKVVESCFTPAAPLEGELGVEGPKQHAGDVHGGSVCCGWNWLGKV